MKTSSFFFNDTSTTEIYTLSLHDALPIYAPRHGRLPRAARAARGGASDAPPRAARAALGRSEEHTSELQSLAYLVCSLVLEKNIISFSAECSGDCAAYVPALAKSLAIAKI